MPERLCGLLSTVVERYFAFRYRLEPSLEQERLLWSYVGTCRFVHNAALLYLSESYRLWKARGSDPHRRPARSWQGLANELPVTRGPNRVALDDRLAWLTETPKHFLQQVLIDLQSGFDAFFDGRGGYPKPHKKYRNDSFRVPEAKSVRVDAARQKYVGLPKLGWVRMSLSKRSAKKYGVTFSLPYRGVLKNATVSFEQGQWWISLCCIERIILPVISGAEVGIDMGVAQPVTLLTGEVIDLPKMSPSERARRSGLAAQVSKTRRGSRNHRKARTKLTVFDRRMTNRRRDAANKSTTWLAKSHSLIVIEDLKIRNMTRSAKGNQDDHGRNVRAKSGLNRSLLDIAPGTIRRKLEYKGPWYGCEIVAVPARNTSRRCSQCDYLPQHGAPPNRESQARFVCKQCGWTANADHNAALNILAAGSAVTACQVPETQKQRTGGSNRKRAA